MLVREDRERFINGTWSAIVNESAESAAILPVPREVGNRDLGNFVLDPAEQPLFWCQVLGALFFAFPHRHGYGIVKNKCPDETQYQL